MKSFSVDNYIKSILDINNINYNNNLLYQKLLLDSKHSNELDYNINNILLDYFPNKDAMIYFNIITYLKNNILDFYVFHDSLEKNLDIYIPNHKQGDFAYLMFDIFIKNKDNSNYNIIFYYYQKLLDYYLIYILNYIILLFDNDFFLGDKCVHLINNNHIKKNLTFNKLLNYISFHIIDNNSIINIDELINLKFILLKEINKLNIININFYIEQYLDIDNSSLESNVKKRKIELNLL